MKTTILLAVSAIYHLFQKYFFTYQWYIYKFACYKLILATDISMNYLSYNKITLWAIYDNGRVESFHVSPLETIPNLCLRPHISELVKNRASTKSKFLSAKLITIWNSFMFKLFSV